MYGNAGSYPSFGWGQIIQDLGNLGSATYNYVENTPVPTSGAPAVAYSYPFGFAYANPYGDPYAGGPTANPFSPNYGTSPNGPTSQYSTLLLIGGAILVLYLLLK